jgi:hypothetical protein
MATLEEDLAALATMSPAQLRARWELDFRTPAPWAYGPDLLGRGIAYRLQEKAYGGLGLQAQREIARLGDALRAGTAEPLPSLRSGTRLAREWHGRTHHVDVTDKGFRYRERDYRSLTAIAREITGAGWSGPRFFGLQKRSGTRAAD